MREQAGRPTCDLPKKCFSYHLWDSSTHALRPATKESAAASIGRRADIYIGTRTSDGWYYGRRENHARALGGKGQTSLVYHNLSANGPTKSIHPAYWMRQPRSGTKMSSTLHTAELSGVLVRVDEFCQARKSSGPRDAGRSDWERR